MRPAPPAPRFLVRHAKAEKTAPGGDAARPLSVEGRRRFQALLAELGQALAVRRILTSPLVRARETAALLAAATGARVEVEQRLASGASSGRELLDLAEAAGPGVALVGHNPELGEAIALAAGQGAEVPPGTVAALGAAGRLDWLRSP